MRQLKKEKILFKRIILLLIIILMFFYQIIPSTIYADDELEGADEGDIGGVLFGPISSLICGIGDAANKILQLIIIGDNSPVFIDQGFFSNTKVNEFLSDTANAPDSNLDTIYVVKEYIASWTGKGYGVPNIKLTPAEIFAGNVAALDANFFEIGATYDDKLGGADKSIVVTLKETVSKWYVALRNIAIVGLLSVLLYIGIRIIISSNAGEKAKYKQFFADWIIALCLIFFLHYIMAFTMTMSETVTDILSGNTATQGTIKQLNIMLTEEDGSTVITEDGTDRYFSSNFVGVARLKAQYDSSILMMGYSVMYIALTIYTVYFTIIYLKRLIMLAFFTMIAPLVALTYPLDKMKDGKAQAFDYWFKEYMFYALLQPVHMLLYTVFVSSALSISSKNLLYAIIALAAIVPAEKIVKQMFGIKGSTESALGGFAGGALASQAFSALSKAKGGGNKPNQSPNNNKIRIPKNPNSNDNIGTLAGDAAGLDPATLAAGGMMGAAAATAASDVDQNTGYMGGAETGGPSAADAYQNTKDPVAAAEREALEEKIADGQIDESELTDEQRALLGMNNPSQETTPPQPDPEPQPETTPTPEEDPYSGHKHRIANNFKNAVKSRYVRAGGAKNIAKNMAIGAAKGYGRAFGAVTMGAIGLGAGMVGGNMGDMVTGATAGLAAGSAISKRTNEMAGRVLTGNTAVGRFASDVLHGDEDRTRENFVKQYMNSQETRDRIMETNPNIGIKELKAKQRAEAEMMYDTGIDDYKQIKAAVKMEKELGDEGNSNSHNMAVTLAKLGQGYDNSTFTDQQRFNKAQEALKNRIEAQMNQNPNGASAEHISSQANAEAKKTLERIRKMKKL